MTRVVLSVLKILGLSFQVGRIVNDGVLGFGLDAVCTAIFSMNFAKFLSIEEVCDNMLNLVREDTKKSLLNGQNMNRKDSQIQDSALDGQTYAVWSVRVSYKYIYPKKTQGLFPSISNIIKNHAQ